MSTEATRRRARAAVLPRRRRGGGATARGGGGGQRTAAERSFDAAVDAARLRVGRAVVLGDPALSTQAHESDVNVMSWNRRVNTLATGADDGGVRIWDPDHGARLGPKRRRDPRAAYALRRGPTILRGKRSSRVRGQLPVPPRLGGRPWSGRGSTARDARVRRGGHTVCVWDPAVERDAEEEAAAMARGWGTTRWRPRTRRRSRSCSCTGMSATIEGDPLAPPDPAGGWHRGGRIQRVQGVQRRERGGNVLDLAAIGELSKSRTHYSFPRNFRCVPVCISSGLDTPRRPRACRVALFIFGSSVENLTRPPSGRTRGRTTARDVSVRAWMPAWARARWCARHGGRRLGLGAPSADAREVDVDPTCRVAPSWLAVARARGTGGGRERHVHVRDIDTVPDRSERARAPAHFMRFDVVKTLRVPVSEPAAVRREAGRSPSRSSGGSRARRT